MKKFEILKAVADFAESCEANGVELFFNYSPNCDMVRLMVWSGGKYSEDSTIEFSECIYFDDKPYDKLKQVIESIIDKYYRA